MNKLYSQIASLIVVVGLGTAWVFNIITAVEFTTISGTVLSAIFALYQKYVKDEIIKTNLKLEDELSSAKKYSQIQKDSIKNLTSYNKELKESKEVKIEEDISVVPEITIKTKRIRKK